MKEKNSSEQTATNRPLTITRKLADGPDYSPDWRHQVAQGYLAKMGQSSPPKDILRDEKDDYVSSLALFLHGAPPFKSDIDVNYAVRCSKTDPIANMIKAMVIANRSAEDIAAEVGPDPVNITTFEKLFFDVRPYLKNQAWLLSICTHRFLKVAFERGWPGVQEVVLGRVLKGTSFDAAHLNRIAASRAKDYLLSLDASDTPSNTKDLQALALVTRMQKSGLSYLWDEPAEEIAVGSKALDEKLKKLPFAGRERVRLFLEAFMEAAVAYAEKSEPLDSPPRDGNSPTQDTPLIEGNPALRG